MRKHEKALVRSAGTPGRVVISWTMSGGVLGGAAASLLTLAEMLPGNELFLTVSALFGTGLLIGLIHGTVLGFFSRPPDVTAGKAMGQVLIGWLYSLLGAPISFLVAVWIGFTVFAVQIPSAGTIIGTVVGWWIGLAILMWTARETWVGFSNIMRRWPDWTIAFLITAVAFLVLVWFFGVYGSYVGTPNTRRALFFAGGIAVWIIGPATTIGLLLLRRLIRLEALARELNIMIDTEAEKK